MSDKKSPNLLIKGRTLSSAWDQQQKARQEDARRRRQHQDAQFALSQQRMTMDGKDVGVARLGSNRLITDDAPRLVLSYRNYDQEGISEITFVPRQDKPSEMEMMFTLVCIGCLKRGIPQEDAQLMVRQTHREFSIDDRPQNKRPRFVENFGMVSPAGLVTAKDTIRCSNVNCSWAVKIIDSIVEEV